MGGRRGGGWWDLTGSFYIIWWPPRLVVRNLLGWPPFVSQINRDDPTPQKRQRQKTKDVEKMEKDKPNANETFWMAIGKKKKHCLYKLSLQRSFVFKIERNFGGFNNKKRLCYFCTKYLLHWMVYQVSKVMRFLLGLLIWWRANVW